MSTLYSQGASLGNKHKQKDLPKNNKECNLPYLAVGVTVSQFTMVLEGFDLAIVLTNLFLTCNFNMGPGHTLTNLFLEKFYWKLKIFSISTKLFSKIGLLLCALRYTLVKSF